MYLASGRSQSTPTYFPPIKRCPKFRERRGVLMADVSARDGPLWVNSGLGILLCMCLREVVHENNRRWEKGSRSSKERKRGRLRRSESSLSCDKIVQSEGLVGMEVGGWLVPKRSSATQPTRLRCSPLPTGWNWVYLS